MKLPIEEKIEMPSEVTATLMNNILTVKGPKGEVSRSFEHPKIEGTFKNNMLRFYCKIGTRREKNIMYTFVAHVKNLIKGVQEPYVYKLKVCSGHFPMNVALNGDKLEVKNFLGEKFPRRLKVKKGASVKVNGPDIVIESVDLETAGAIASDIERLMTKGTRDLRVFQDGIYITEKPTKRK